MSKQETPLKQRLVGAIVLVALGVIFIPMFLGGEGERGVPLFGTNVPDKPAALEELGQSQPGHQLPPPPPPEEVRTLVDAQSPPAAVAETPASPASPEAAAPPVPAPAPSPASPGAAPKPETPPAATPGPAANPLSWAVQVGSFSQRARALKLRDRLRKAGFQAFAEAVTTREGRRFRVRVGPVGARDKAERLRAAVARKLELEGFVVRHP